MGAKQPPLVEKTCKVCSGTFVVSKYRVKYKHTCSHACRVEASAAGSRKGVTQVVRQCPECGATFSVVKGQEKNKQYCSAACGHAARAKALSKAVATKCAVCDVEFMRRLSRASQTTCSPRCAEVKKKEVWARGRGLGTPESAAAAALHRAKKKGAVPKWYDADNVLALYALTDSVRRTIRVNYHVDHIVPLTSALVCGLHWSGNLRVLRSRDNLSKGNKVWPDMP